MRGLQVAKRLFSSGSSGVSVKVAVARAAKQPFTIENARLRDIRSNEVLVRIVSTGICHTDLVTKDWGGAAYPIVLGHEGTGVVERVGSAVTDFSSGDQVLMSYAACGSCPHCLQGKPPYCYNHGSLNFAGTHPDGSLTHYFPNSSEKLHGSFFQQSSFATHAIASPQNILKVPKFSKLPLHALAPLGCGVQTGAGAVINTLKASVGSSLAVFGCGAVGLSAIMAAKVAGCAKIVAVDVKPSRLELAKELGATHTVVPTQGNVVEHLKDLTGGVGIDYALDTSGNPAAVRSAFESLKALGVCGVIAGAPPGTNIAIETLSLLPGKQLRGVIQGDSVPRLFIPEMLRLHSEGRFPFEKMITYFNGLEEINKAADAAKDGSAIKPVIKVSDL